jgi:alanyl-tRNA synthetase
MAQFKAYFSGELQPPHPRIATSQKCFRTTDIEEVGDDTHLTLFEMLGNFSFGDYFKQEACKWALDLMTNDLGFEFERLYFTVYKTDEEAENIWIDLGIPIERIYRFGDEDNWWGPAGEEGPCGPSSEINYYTGSLKDMPKVVDRDETANWGPNNNETFLELYNLVFTQFNRDLNKNDSILPAKNIDTGMGLERTLAILQKVTSVYETDLFRPLISHIEKSTKINWGKSQKGDTAIKVVAEHARSATFLIADGVIPENTGRGYVLRRLIRRGMLFGRELGMESSQLSNFVGTIVREMGSHYPELIDNEQFIVEVLEKEEKTFSQTLNFGTSVLKGMVNYRSKIKDPNYHLLSGKESRKSDDPISIGYRLADESIKNQIKTNAETRENELVKKWKRTISATEIFVLYDTYGFPPEVTKESVQGEDIDVDIDGFNKEMNKQRERGRISGKKFAAGNTEMKFYEKLNHPPIVFTGYESTKLLTKVTALIKDGKVVEEARMNDNVEIILQKTPFYAERGGQVGDTGILINKETQINVLDTQAPVGYLNIHISHVTNGFLRVGDSVTASVDKDRREKIKRNHTATHLLHAALREIIGPHVKQSGSLVESDRLRFDFTNMEAIGDYEIAEIELKVNEKIRNNIPVEIHWTTYSKAVAEGALAFFGDTYENKVRTIKIDAPWSYELCGGTHMDFTGGIGPFIITSEVGIGSGMRRIEALTGIKAEQTIRGHADLLKTLSKQLNAAPDTLIEKVSEIQQDSVLSKKALLDLESELMKAQLKGGTETTKTYQITTPKGTITLETAEISTSNINNLRKAADDLKTQYKIGVVIVGGNINNRPSIVVMATNGAVKLGVNSGNIAKYLAGLMGGGGGGSALNAQAGGKNVRQLKETLNHSQSAVEQSLEIN